MMLHVKSAKHISEYVLWVSFDDGSAGRVNLKDHLVGSVFTPLRDVKIFSRVSVDPELETVVWPNGADLAPEFLKELQNKQSQAGA